MKRNAFHILLVLAGLAAMLAGLFWARAVPDAVPAYLCLGLGTGALGVSRQTIGSLENGRYNPSILLAFRIARYFGMQIEDIFIYEEESK